MRFVFVWCPVILQLSGTFALTVLLHACRDDRERHVSDEEEEDRRSKHKRKGGGGGGRDQKRSRR